MSSAAPLLANPHFRRLLLQSLLILLTPTAAIPIARGVSADGFGY